MARQVQPWMEQLKVEDLPESYQELARAIGVPAFLRLSSVMGGCNLYVPKIERLTTELRDERIRAEFDGANHKVLAIRYNLSERRIREIVAPASVEQSSLF